MTTESRIITDYRNELISLNAQTEYCKAAILSGLEKWEEKEYMAVIDMNNERKKVIKSIFDQLNIQ